MRRLMKGLGLAVAVLALIAGTARSATAGLVFDQTIAGFTIGTDIPTGGFVTNTDNGALIGLRASERYEGLLPQTNDGVVATYYARTGNSISPPPNAARWNLDFYVDFGTSNYTMATLTGTGLDGQSLGAPLNLATIYGSGSILQDSTNLGYVLPVSAQYNPNTPGTYTFTLTLSGDSNHADLTETISIKAVPEPSTLVSASIAGVLGISFAWRRRKSAKI